MAGTSDSGEASSSQSQMSQADPDDIFLNIQRASSITKSIYFDFYSLSKSEFIRNVKDLGNDLLNIDLLQYESHTSTNDFLNTMISNSFLPYILQPTRVTDHSSTVIDNIFSNVTDFVTSSGNITSLVADHFAQFKVSCQL